MHPDPSGGRGRLALALAALAVVGIACGPRSQGTGAVGTAHDSTSNPAPTPGPFLESGALLAAGGGGSDAVQISSLVAASAPEGDRFVVGFSRADGLPASHVGPFSVEFLRELRVVRIRLPKEILSTAITDNSFFGTFADRAFVVRGLNDTGMWVDLHVRAAAVARAYVASSPALIVIELKSGGPILTGGPSVGPNAVVLAPPRDGRVSYPLEVSGYARTFEANVEAELRQGGVTKAHTHTTAADYVSTWGEFRLQFTDGPRGQIELWAGEHSAKDGSEIGVTLALGAE